MSLYAEAYRLFKKESYKDVAVKTLQFIENEFRNTSGGFKSSIRADTDEGEGAYYIWTKNQLQATLGSVEEAEKYFELYPFNAEAYVLGRKLQSTSIQFQKCIAKLKNDRALRVKPKTDAKIITSWNALLITAYADAYKAFQDKHYLNEAKKLFAFLEKSDVQGLKHIPSAPQNGVYLDDYAYVIQGSLDLYLVSGDTTYSTKAQLFFNKAQDLFFETSVGLFRYGQNDNLITPVYKTDDDIMPSPNALMALNALKLGKINSIKTYHDLAEDILKNLKSKMLLHPANYTTALDLELSFVYPYYELVIVGQQAETQTKEVWNTYLPNTLVAFSITGEDGTLFENRYDPQETYIYVCQETFCKLPTTDIQEALKQLEST